ncbi:hypothetical protein [Virgibacillus dakarensis]|uniref:hypothetical protein n=1 Tax=Virgibacillus dakarensis TaxID=1917889 RepID=UPI001F3D8EA2|nr:hypothetical protein [Virgibacillus dakarensis]
MQKRMLFTLIMVSALLALSACGGNDNDAEGNNNNDKTADKPKVGLNEITFDDMIAKKDNNEAFYLLIYDAKKDYVKNTKLLEAYDKSLKDEDMKAYYININDLDDDKKQKIDTLSEDYSNRTSGHNPFEDGGMAVVHRGQFNSAYAYQGTAWILNTMIGKANTENKTFLDDDLYSDVKKEIQYNIDYIKEQELELTY